ncbi:hypothetical protein XELAEV_18031231mg [Xenopus laevis]|nr:hypothetical protein XELAEV_18031231mg [Xenopus laevis]
MGPRTFAKPFLGINNYTSPYFQSRNGFHTIHSENSPVKPRIITVVKPGSHPLKKITLLLNKRSVQTFEQLVADISEALGFPRWKNDRVRKLYNLRGKEIRSISDFFRGDDIFIALGREQLTTKCIDSVFDELYPERSLKKSKDQDEKRRYGLENKGLNIDNVYSDTDVEHKCEDTMSPRGATKFDRRTNDKCRAEETKRLKQSDSEKCDKEKEKCFGPIKKAEHHCNKQNLIKCTSLSCLIRCDHCRIHSHRNIHNRDYIKDKSFEGTGTISLQRLPFNKEEFKNCRKCPLGNIQEEDLRLTCKVCNCKLKDTERDGSLGDDLINNNIEMFEKTEWQDSRLPKDNIYRKELKKKQCRDVIDGLPMGTHINVLLQNDSQEPKQSTSFLHGDNRTVNGYGNKKEKTKDFDPQILKTEVGPVGFQPQVRGDAKGNCLFTLKRPCCIKTRRDIESYYEIDRTIGDGNFAVVKVCRPWNENQEYAMKIIDKSKLRGKEEIIENEVRIIKNLSHPNIVKLFSDYETDKEIYLILEYIRGGDLFDVITESIKFTEHDAALMLIDLCEALQYIHSKHIVHRDLKPENLLVQRNPDGSKTLKLADFGLAIYATGPIFTVCGTPTYVAPEILSEKGYGLEVDMWATGVILYILLCGFPPFRSPGRDQEELFQIIQSGEYEFLSPYWDHISEEVKDLISKLLVLNPKIRYSAKCVLQHSWVTSRGQTNSRNLQREVTVNIERHFRNRQKKEVTDADK